MWTTRLSWPAIKRLLRLPKKVDNLAQDGNFHETLVKASIHNAVFIVNGNKGYKDADIIGNPVVPYVGELEL